MKRIYKTKLQKLREEAGISQKRLADSLKVSQTAIGFWERGERVPSVDSARKLADYFGVSTDDLFAPTETEITLGKVKARIPSLSENEKEKLFREARKKDLLMELEFLIDEFSLEELQQLKNYAQYLRFNKKILAEKQISEINSDNDK